jgi:hypothetical protein
MRDRSRENSFPSLAALLAGVIGLIGASQAIGQEVCKPALSISNVQFSKWQLPTLERKWTATVAVDASRCAPNTAGTFEIGFLRLVENGVDIEFTEEFVWMSPAVNVGVDFWANEAVGRSWINKVSACPCAK